jgi:hypothetical protein
MIGIAIKFFMGGMGLITRSATHLLLAACAGLAIWGWFGHHSAAKWKRVLRSTEVAYVAAQKDAKAAQIAANLAATARYSALERKSADDYRPAMESAHSAVIAYVGRMPACPRSASGGTNPAAMPDNPGVDAGPGESSGMAAITVADLDALAGNTVRAESCRAWGQSLIDAGMAITGD